MEIEIEKLRKMLTKAFEDGQKSPDADDYPIRLYVEELIQNES